MSRFFPGSLTVGTAIAGCIKDFAITMAAQVSRVCVDIGELDCIVNNSAWVRIDT
jgi:hypothetical protein